MKFILIMFLASVLEAAELPPSIEFETYRTSPGGVLNGAIDVELDKTSNLAVLLQDIFTKAPGLAVPPGLPDARIGKLVRSGLSHWHFSLSLVGPMTEPNYINLRSASVTIEGDIADELFSILETSYSAHVQRAPGTVQVDFDKLVCIRGAGFRKATLCSINLTRIKKD